ncbi:MAG: class I SAM-dependent methyltransferase [Verrucomicrobiota bacterium]
MSTNETNRSKVEVIDLLFDDSPDFHWWGQKAKNYSIQRPVLDWIAEHTEPDHLTIETGCGYTTVLLGAIGCEHHAVAPVPQEFENIKRWSGEKGIDISKTNFHVTGSQDYLPKCGLSGIDLALIDGAHAFPFPFIDWHYIAEAMKVGGVMLVDDTQLRTVEILREFMLTEPERWELVTELGKTAVFRKISEEVYTKTSDWTAQPYCTEYKSPRFQKNWKAKLRAVPVVGDLASKVNRAIKGGGA